MEGIAWTRRSAARRKYSELSRREASEMILDLRRKAVEQSKKKAEALDVEVHDFLQKNRSASIWNQQLAAHNVPPETIQFWTDACETQELEIEQLLEQHQPEPIIRSFVAFLLQLKKERAWAIYKQQAVRRFQQLTKAWQFDVKQGERDLREQDEHDAQLTKEYAKLINELNQVDMSVSDPNPQETDLHPHAPSVQLTEAEKHVLETINF